MKLSIIIPVYNVAATLDRCLESVVANTTDDMEIILVDDGSKDESGTMCDQWNKRDTHIKVIHKENGGLSDARNHGLEQASGQYVTFVDSDDYIEAQTYTKLLATAEQHPEYDMIEFPVNMHEGGLQEKLLMFKDHAYTDVSQYWYDTQAYMHTYACNKIYKHTLFEHVKFPIGKLFEDSYTMPHLLMQTAVVATSSEGLYHYCNNQQGITAQADGKAWKMLLEAHMEITKMPKFTPYRDKRYYLQLVNIQLFTHELTGAPPVVEDIDLGRIDSIKTLFLHILGIKNLCKVNKLFRKIVRRRS